VLGIMISNRDRGRWFSCSCYLCNTKTKKNNYLNFKTGGIQFFFGHVEDKNLKMWEIRSRSSSSSHHHRHNNNVVGIKILYTIKEYKIDRRVGINRTHVYIKRLHHSTCETANDRFHNLLPIPSSIIVSLACACANTLIIK